MITVATAGWALVESRRVRNQLEQLRLQQSESMRQQQELSAQLEKAQERNNEMLARIDQLQGGGVGLADANSTRNPAPQPSPADAETFDISPLFTMGDRSGNRVRVSAGADRVRLRMVLEQPIRSNYRAELRSAEGKTLFSWDRLQPAASNGAAHLEVVLPIVEIRAGEYQIVVSAPDRRNQPIRIRTYYFTLLKSEPN
jgi:hypothetical protein